MWIPSRGVNGEYGYLNTETGKFRTTLPNSKEEKQKEQQKQRKAALVTHSARQAKYERTDAKRRNHSDETIKKQISIPIITMNPDGTFTNNYVQQMAPNESSLSTHDPIAEFYIGAKALNPVFKGIGNTVLDYTSKGGFNLSYLLNKNKIININNLSPVGSGSESTIYNFGNRVLKVSNNSFNKDNAQIYAKSRILRNRGPYYVKERIEGIVPSSDGTYKVATSQKKLKLNNTFYDSKFLENQMNKAGYNKVPLEEIPYLPGVQKYTNIGTPVYSQYSFIDPQRGISVWSNGSNYIPDVRLEVNSFIIKTPFGKKLINIDNDAVSLTGKYKGLYPLGNPKLNSNILEAVPDKEKVNKDIINYITKYSRFK